VIEKPKGYDAFKTLYPGASLESEAGVRYILVPGLKIVAGNDIIERDALICPQQHGGYTTRLFLSAIIATKSLNWTGTVTILNRPWVTWSWNNVSADLLVLEILANHLRPLQ
jgi:hypothetical protein